MTPETSIEPAALADIFGRAETALAAGDLSQANRLMRALLHAGVADRRIHTMLAEICTRLGLADPALYFHHRPERVVVADYYSEADDIVPFLKPGPPPNAAESEALVAAAYRRLRLQPHLALTVERLAAELLAQRPVLGVHYRAPTFV